MPMGPAEIVASLKELCEQDGPRLTTAQIVEWIDEQRGYDSDVELIAFAKRMKARQFARMLTFEDEDSGRKIKRLWSFPDRAGGRRVYQDICKLPAEKRKKLIAQNDKYLDQIRTVRRAMYDYLAGQEFFEFYEADFETEPASTNGTH